MIIWFSGVTLIGGAMFLGTISFLLFDRPHLTGPYWMGFVIPPILLGFGLALVQVGRFLARDERQFISDYIVSSIQAVQNTAQQDAAANP